MQEKEENFYSELSKIKWTGEEYAAFLKKLPALRDEKYRNFHAGLLPTMPMEQLIGIRTPVLKRLAKEIAKGEYPLFLKVCGSTYYEERILRGLVIGSVPAKRMTLFSFQRFLTEFVPTIDNWAICDLCCSSFHITKRYQEEMFEFLLPYTKSQKTYEQRFAIVMLLDYYVTDEYIQEVLSILEGIKSTEYYVNMAIAWAASVCYVSFPEPTMEWLLKRRENLLSQGEAVTEQEAADYFVYQKTLSKIIESFRVSKEQKEEIRRLRIKK